MPHLSPIMWAALPLIFWLLFAALMSLVWWHQTPTLPNLQTSESSTPQSAWKWEN